MSLVDRLRLADPGLHARQVSENLVRTMLLTILLTMGVLLVLAPLCSLLVQSFQDDSGRFVGLGNFVAYAHDPSLRRSVVNSATIGLLSTVITVPLAFVYAYGLTRCRLPLRPVFKSVALLPILAPSMLPAIALIYIFGNQGFLRAWMGSVSIYGPLGIVVAQVFHCFPHAVLILTTALAAADARLYESAETLGTSPSRMFWTITFPGARYGIVNACFVVFTIAVVDFGIAKVIGGQYNVLAIDVYRQIIGQQNFKMGAVIGVVLLLPSVVTFTIERWMYRRQVSQISGRAELMQPARRPVIDGLMLTVATLTAFLILSILGTAVFASFVKLWPYDLSFSLGSYDFNAYDPDGWGSYWNSVSLAAGTATAGTIMAFIGAYLAEKARKASRLSDAFHVIAMAPLAIPGIVLGLGYVFFYNALWNPLNIIYGSILMLTMCTVGHYYTVPHLMALSTLKQIDQEFEAASDALGVPFWVTLRRVTVPISLPAIVDIATYFFVNAMTTVAALIFIYSAVTKVASVSIVTLDDTGDEGAACAMAMMIVYTSLAVKIVQEVVMRTLLPQQRWRSASPHGTDL